MPLVKIHRLFGGKFSEKNAPAYSLTVLGIGRRPLSLSRIFLRYLYPLFNSFAVYCRERILASYVANCKAYFFNTEVIL